MDNSSDLDGDGCRDIDEDTDDDGDSILDVDDNCQYVVNPLQETTKEMELEIFVTEMTTVESTI